MPAAVRASNSSGRSSSERQRAPQQPRRTGLREQVEHRPSDDLVGGHPEHAGTGLVDLQHHPVTVDEQHLVREVAQQAHAVELTPIALREVLLQGQSHETGDQHREADSGDRQGERGRAEHVALALPRRDRRDRDRGHAGEVQAADRQREPTGDFDAAAEARQYASPRQGEDGEPDADQDRGGDVGGVEQHEAGGGHRADAEVVHAGDRQPEHGAGQHDPERGGG